MNGYLSPKQACDQDDRTMRRVRAEIQGVVQGVGFRPFIYQWAERLSLSGWVENTRLGVRMEIEGAPDEVAALLDRVAKEPPGNAAVSSVCTKEITPRGESGFAIRKSALKGVNGAQLLPDIATCEECLRELFDPSDRRYLYPFINCTHCGPRFSIIENLPYDRVRTSMRHFPMCPACRSEYEDPLSRRFHAEPNACGECGPRVLVCDRSGARLAENHEALLAAAQAIREGMIVAAKGIGGFHLIADARNHQGIAALRARKHRPDKPFAVMFPSLNAVEAECRVLESERALLISSARPIVLVQRRKDTIASNVAPENPWVGAFLPYAPIHHLLMRELGFPVVATSGNLSDEPIAIDETEARKRLGEIADLFLIHDRPILRPVDDSIVRVVDEQAMMLRRARGFAPAVVAKGGFAPGVLALGGHLKTSVAVTRSDTVMLSQHLGGLGTAGGRAAHTNAVRDMTALHGIDPQIVVHDLHPDYATTQAAEKMDLPRLGVQHHAAHIAACMAEHGIEGPVLGVAWDGAGYGLDDTIWGGEFIVVAKGTWRRVGHLRTFCLPGGVAAIREPRRAAAGVLFEAFGEAAFGSVNLPPMAAFSPTEIRAIRTMLMRGINSPRTSSTGRLFDAFASLCGIRQGSSYEGQAAMGLEWAAKDDESKEPYEFPLRSESSRGKPWIVDWAPTLKSAIADIEAGVSPGAMSAAFHQGLAASIVAGAKDIGLGPVVLTGGCFQNGRLTEAAIAALRCAGFRPFWPQRVPPNDGGLALGQAAWASWTLELEKQSCA